MNTNVTSADLAAFLGIHLLEVTFQYRAFFTYKLTYFTLTLKIEILTFELFRVPQGVVFKGVNPYNFSISMIVSKEVLT